jgi:hypothetical protein
MADYQDIDFPIENKGYLAVSVLRLGYTHFLDLANFIRSLPYGRTSDTQNVLAVINEKRGTCSSKHVLLTALAHECGHGDIQLMVGIYKMCEENTPGVGKLLKEAGLSYLPEAHNYLLFNTKRYDFTGLKEGKSSPFDSLFFEQSVNVGELFQIKKALHQAEISKFAEQLKLDAQNIWKIREACIQVLSTR